MTEINVKVVRDLIEGHFTPSFVPFASWSYRLCVDTVPDVVVTPAISANPIAVNSFLQYVVNHQNDLPAAYDEEFKVRFLLVRCFIYRSSLWKKLPPLPNTNSFLMIILRKFTTEFPFINGKLRKGTKIRCCMYTLNGLSFWGENVFFFRGFFWWSESEFFYFKIFECVGTKNREYFFTRQYL